jgi:hypothetical protein
MPLDSQRRVLFFLSPLREKVQCCSTFDVQARLWVPSPLVGEGQDEGALLRRSLLPCDTLTLTLSHQGRGDLTNK